MTNLTLADRSGTLAILLLHTQIEHHDEETQARAGYYTTTLLQFQRLLYQGMVLPVSISSTSLEAELNNVRAAMVEYMAGHPTRGN